MSSSDHPPAATLLADITPMVITFNEAANLERTLARLVWAARIVVIDSGSSDATLQIAARYPQVEVFHRPFDSFAGQCNFGLSKIHSPWVLSLDADYELSDAFLEEVAKLRDRGLSGYRARFVYRLHGRALRATLYPPRTVLYRVARARYEDFGHGHKVLVQGPVGGLDGVIYHDDRKPLERWMASQIHYARREAEYLLTTPRPRLSRSDRLRRTCWIGPLAILPYVLLYKGCLFDGAAGWSYALQRLFAEVAIALAVLERRLLALDAGTVKGTGPNGRRAGAARPHPGERA